MMNIKKVKKLKESMFVETLCPEPICGIRIGADPGF